LHGTKGNSICLEEFLSSKVLEGLDFSDRDVKNVFFICSKESILSLSLSLRYFILDLRLKDIICINKKFTLLQSGTAIFYNIRKEDQYKKPVIFDM
jgi:hypothetical protein